MAIKPLPHVPHASGCGAAPRARTRARALWGPGRPTCSGTLASFRWSTYPTLMCFSASCSFPCSSTRLALLLLPSSSGWAPRTLFHASFGLSAPCPCCAGLALVSGSSFWRSRLRASSCGSCGPAGTAWRQHGSRTWKWPGMRPPSGKFMLKDQSTYEARPRQVWVGRHVSYTFRGTVQRKPRAMPMLRQRDHKYFAAHPCVTTDATIQSLALRGSSTGWRRGCNQSALCYIPPSTGAIALAACRPRGWGGGGGPCMRHPPAPPPLRVLKDSGAGAVAPMAPNFLSHAELKGVPHLWS